MSIETGFKGLQLQAKALSQSVEKGWQSGGMALPFSLGENAGGSKGASFAAMLQSSSRQAERVPVPAAAPRPERPAARDDRSTATERSSRQDTDRRPDSAVKSSHDQRRADDTRDSARKDKTAEAKDLETEASTASTTRTADTAAAGTELTETPPFSEELNALVEDLPTEELVAAFADLSALAEDADGLTVDELKGWLEENSELLQQTVDMFSHVPTEELQAMLDEAGVAPESQSMLQAILSFSEIDITPELEAAGATEAEVAELLGIDGDLASALRDVSDGVQQIAAHIAVVADNASVAMNDDTSLPAGLVAASGKETSASGQPGSDTSGDGASTSDAPAAAPGAATKPAGEGIATNERLMFAQMLASREGAAADDNASVRQAGGQLTPLAAAVSGPAQASTNADQAGKPLLPFQTSLQSSINDSIEWKEQFEQKLSWFLKEGIRSARLQLNPTDMGPIDVRIQVQKDQAQIHVFAQNQQVREMLENTSHRLRDMLASQNIDLSGFDVSSQGRDGQAGQPGGEQGSGAYGGTATPTAGELELEAAEVLVGSQNIRLVDQYV
ncbi:flagellar hook-length control protein FliK [Allohahella marinimesophila]|uniref:Flagellar hook-length control protein-like C-terminal domain-containing protein n=1 Tax=Allohahella marinimesophila TaxID=1054972 RepID=A0ABP7PPC9_9GAMM